MSFMGVAVGLGASGIGATMLAGGMMGGALGGVSNLIQGKDVFSNLGQNMITGAAGAGIVSGLGAAAGGVGTTTTSTIAGDMAAPSYSQWEQTQALLDAAPTASSNVVTSSIPNTIAPMGTPLPPAVPELSEYGNKAFPIGNIPASGQFESSVLQTPATTQLLTAQPSYGSPTTTGMLPNNTTTVTNPPAEFMKNPADYMVQNPSKVAGMGMGLNSLLNPQQQGIANSLTDKTGYAPKFTWDQKTQKYVSAAPTPYTYKGAEGGEIKGYAGKRGSYVPKSASVRGSPYEDDEVDMLSRDRALQELIASLSGTNPMLEAPYTRMAQGGIAALGGEYAAGGKLLQGPGDGMSDSIPAVIQGARPQRAALAQGEFVVPADVVSHLGNGSTDAGAKRLYAMMDKIRHARTGNKKQGRQINPNKFLPV